jgi:hypothetical protein
MNMITRDREKEVEKEREKERERLRAQAASSSPQKAMPSHDRPEENVTKGSLSDFEVRLIIAAFMALVMTFMD